MELQSDRQEWLDGQQPSPKRGRGPRSGTVNVSNCEGAARNQLILLARSCSRLSRHRQEKADVKRHYMRYGYCVIYSIIAVAE